MSSNLKVVNMIGKWKGVYLTYPIYLNMYTLAYERVAALLYILSMCVLHFSW